MASVRRIQGQQLMLEHLPMSKLEATTILDLTDPQYRVEVIQGRKHDIPVLRALRVARTYAMV